MPCTFVPRYLLQRLVAVSDDDHVCHSGRRTLELDRERATTNGGALSARRPPQYRSPDQSRPDRDVSTANRSERLPGRPVRGEGDPPSGDQSVDGAFDLAGSLFELADIVCGPDPWPLPSLAVTLHYGNHYDNAFWDGARLAFGEGDGTVFTPFAAHPDVVAHLFGHGVLDSFVSPVPRGQSGAVAESLADVFASVFTQWRGLQTADVADWVIGRGVFSERIDAPALRSMIDPGTAYDDPSIGSDPQVGSMIDFAHSQDDDRDVHINSGIPNRAFALAARAIGGHSWDRAAPVWFDALASGRIEADVDFATFARHCAASARSLFPDQPSIAQAVREAWTEVGVPIGAASASRP